MTRHILAVLAMGVLAVATGCHAIDFYTPSLQKPDSTGNGAAPGALDGIAAGLSHCTARRASDRGGETGASGFLPIGPSDVLLIHVLGTSGAIRSPSVPRGGRRKRQSRGAVRNGSGGGADGRGGQADLTRFLKMILRGARRIRPVDAIRRRRTNHRPIPVQPDGTVNLRNYGMVYVAGKTVTEAREAVQARLAQYFDSPQVGVDVVQFNSKSYYVVSESLLGGGTMLRFPITGNETVLDAIAQLEESDA